MKRLAIVGLLAACAVASSAAPTSVALAAPTESSTGFTCVETETGKGEFENAHCNPNGPEEGKNWKHVAIPAGTTTQLTLSDSDGKGGSLGMTEIILPFGGPEIVFKAQHVECVNCMIENRSEGEGSVMYMAGEGGKLRYTSVTTNFLGCTVKNAEFTTEPLSFTTTSASQIEIAPASGTTVAVIHLEGGGSGCGATFPLLGRFTGILEGATVTFTDAGELFWNAEAEAFLAGTGTVQSGLTVEPENHHPLALTE